IPNDTVLMFGFAGGPADVAGTLEVLLARARSCPELSVRVDDGGSGGYPRWVRRDVDRSNFVVHDLEERTWTACLAAVGALTADQLDATDVAWRLHVFT